MSVIKNKRSQSSAEFIENLKCLEQEVLTWCKSQGNKNNDYGLTDLFKCTQKAYANAFMGNKIYLTEESIEQRKKCFDNSICFLRTFNAELTALSVCFPISNTKIKRWMRYVYKSISQMNNIKKSDKARIDKKHKNHMK